MFLLKEGKPIFYQEDQKKVDELFLISEVYCEEK